MQITTNESSGALKITGTLDISVAEELHKALGDFIAVNPHPVLDLAEVDACDTAALQLLYAACRTAEHANKRLQLARLSDAVRNTGAALGLSIEVLAAAPAVPGAEGKSVVI